MRQLRFGADIASALLPLCLLLAVGCAQIIGLDDYTVARGGSGGTVSTTGGSAAMAGEAGAPSEGGTLGRGGSAGAPAGGSGPTIPVSCDGKTPILLTQATKDVLATCIYRNACSPLVPVRTISKCLTNNTPDAFAADHACHVASCADYQSCEHNGIPGADVCTAAKAGTNFCSGNKAVSCDATDPNLNFFADCVALGANGCGTYLDGDNVLQSACTLTGATTSCAGQPADSGNLCSTEDPALYEYQCIGGKAYGTQCGDFTSCALDSSGAAHCFLQGSTCTATQCSADGKIATACFDGGGYQYNCGSVGLSCALSATAQTDGDTNYCVAPSCKPADVNNCTESCTGSKLNLCYGGAQITVDCADYGFATCDDTFVDSNQDPYATCVN